MTWAWAACALASVAESFRAVSEQRTRNKSAEFRWWGPERVLESVHGENEGSSSLFLFFPVHFSPDLLGSWLCIILDPTAASSKKSTDRKLRCFLLLIFFVFIFCFVSFRFFFSTCYCHFFAFCCIFFPYRYQIRLKSNKLFHSPPFTTFGIFTLHIIWRRLTNEIIPSCFLRSRGSAAKDPEKICPSREEFSNL